MRPTLFRLALLILAVGLLPAGAFAQRGKPSPSPVKATPSPAPIASSVPTPTPLPQYALPDPVATVNGQPIHPAELARITEVLLNAGGHSLKTLSVPDQKRAYQQTLASLLIDRLITALAANEIVSPATVDARLEDLRRQYPNAAALDADLKRNNQTPELVRTNIHNEVAREQWVDRQIAGEVEVAPAEVEKFYQEGPPNKFDEPEKVAASHILVKVRRDAPPEEALTAENRANEAADHLKKGEPFDDVALKYSDDPTVKKNHGNLGLFERDAVMPEFATAAFALKPGEVSPPVRTQFGYHVIKVTDRKPAHTDTLDEARPRILTFLREQKRQQATARLVQRLRAGAKIEIPEDLRDASETPTASPTS